MRLVRFFFFFFLLDVYKRQVLQFVRVPVPADEHGDLFAAFRDRYTHELEYMRADKWKCPDTICNVKVSLEQKAAFEAGQRCV